MPSPQGDCGAGGGRLIAAVLLSVIALVSLSACASSGRRAPFRATPTPTSLSSTATTEQAEGAFRDTPIMPGAMRVSRGVGSIKYVLHGDQQDGMYAFYARELPRRGWTEPDQMGSVALYKRGALRIGVGRTWMGNGDTLVNIFWAHW